MKPQNVILTAAALTAFVGTSTTALADAHADIDAITCAEFAGMELADQQEMMPVIAASAEDQDVDELTIGKIGVLCNGDDDETLGSVLNTEIGN